MVQFFSFIVQFARTLAIIRNRFIFLSSKINSILSESFELPPIEEIEEMDRQRKQSIESLVISNGKVECQKCGIAVRIVGKMSRPHNDRVVTLQKRIGWLETCPYVNIDSIKALKAELADLLEKDAEFEKLRCLPLYGCRITGWKFVCSSCYENLYRAKGRRKKRVLLPHPP